MKRTLYNLVVFAILISPLALINCGDGNPLIDLSDPSTFPGIYKLISIADKNGEDFPAGLTIKAGEPTTVTIEGGTVTFTVTGTLTLTDTRFTFSMPVKVAITDSPEETETETVTGTYSISDFTLTAVSDDSENGTRTFTVSASGSELTMEDDEQKLVFEKQ